MKIAGMVVLGLVVLVSAGACLNSWLMNPRVVRELREQPDGERAKKVMLLSLPSGKQIPVNYLRDEGVVYAAADFPWWRELGDEPKPVTVLVRGEELRGKARAVRDDSELRASVFARLRPTAPSFAGTLVEVVLD